MSLGQDIAAALPEMRAQAESLMQDTCSITIPDPDGEPVWDDEDGVWGDPEPLVIYSGKCRIRQPAVGSREDAGESSFSVSDRVVSIPLTVLTIPVGAAVTVTATVGEASLAGAVFTYVSPASQQTHSTARRLLCRKVD